MTMSVRVVLVMAALATAASFVPTASEAQEYPWCVQYGGPEDAGTNCGFVSREQCMATASGAGYCYPNPAYPERPAPKTRKRQSR
jgi:hypothetical protein